MAKNILSKKLQEESVCYLRAYLTKERKRPLNEEHVKAVKDLIAQREEENSSFADTIIASDLCHLAVVELVRENKARKTVTNTETTYDVNAKDVLVTMLDIVDICKRKKIKLFHDEVVEEE